MVRSTCSGRRTIHLVPSGAVRSSTGTVEAEWHGFRTGLGQAKRRGEWSLISVSARQGVGVDVVVVVVVFIVVDSGLALTLIGN
jgi:hypothetical protein